MGSRYYSKRARRKQKNVDDDRTGEQSPGTGSISHTAQKVTLNINDGYTTSAICESTSEPYVTTLAKQLEYRTMEEMEETEGGEFVFRAFLTSPGEPEDCATAADYIWSVCPYGKLSGVDLEDEETGCERIALVGEARRDEKGAVLMDARSAPLSAKDLGHMKMMPVIMSPNRTLNQPTRPRRSCRKRNARAASAGHGLNAAESTTERAAAQRRIFITDLNRRSIQGLMKTCLRYEAFHLRSAIYKHMSGEVGLSYFTSTDDQPQFRYSLHLPFVVWQDGGVRAEDTRRRDNGLRIRRTEEVTTLDWEFQSGDKSFLYESHITCVIGGFDPWHWVGWCFIDNYYNRHAEVSETPECYIDDQENGLQTDPFLWGGTDIRKWSAHEYFLQIAVARIAQISFHWRRVIDRARQSIHVYKDKQDSFSHFGTPLGACVSQKMLIHEDFMHKKSLYSELSDTLSSTVTVCEKFQKLHRANFRDFPVAWDKLRNHIAELEELSCHLKDCARKYEIFSKDFELRLNNDTHENGKSQRRIALEGKHLNRLLILFATPLALAIATFTVEKPFIPQLPRNFWAFILVDVIYTAVSLLILSVISLERQLADPSAILEKSIRWLQVGLHWLMWWRTWRKLGMVRGKVDDDLELGNMGSHDRGETSYQRESIDDS